MHHRLLLAPPHSWETDIIFNNLLKVLFGCWREKLEFCG
jgi:hypothetical protein